MTKIKLSRKIYLIIFLLAILVIGLTAISRLRKLVQAQELISIVRLLLAYGTSNPDLDENDDGKINNLDIFKIIFSSPCPSPSPSPSPSSSPNASLKKVAIIEFKYINDPKVDFYYEFYCNSQDCIFRTPDQDPQYFINWCGLNCQIETKSFFDVFNNLEGITNIYPTGSSEPKYSYFSIYQLSEFYQSEAQRYGLDFGLNLEIKGPYVLAEKPPQRLRDDPPDELEEFFDNEAENHGINLDTYDIINYIYFTSEDYFVGTISGNKTFCQAFIHFDEFFGNIMTVAHEMGHTFGMYDTYYPGSWACQYPDGYPEPSKEPLYPQSYACLMCKSIMLSETNTRGPYDFNELRVCDKTAEVFGWK